MAFHYSRPFESLIGDRPGGGTHLTTARVVIVGSGYGGSVAAFRLANPAFTATEDYQHDVLVLERGKEYALGEFPNDLSDLPAHVRVRQANRRSTGSEDALFDIRLGEGVDALVGSGLGGTSLINASVAIRPPTVGFTSDPWPAAFRNKEIQAELDDAFTRVGAWLGIASEADRQKLKSLAKYQALSRYAGALKFDIEPAPVTIALQKKKNAAGITQEACTRCGNCVTGCNVGAKNTLAMNLIPAAAACGAEFYTGAIVYGIEPIAATATRARHWRVYVKPVSRTTRARFDERFYIEADTVILSAGTLGSTEILQRSKRLGYVHCSGELGKRFSTNGDGISMSFAERDSVDALGSPNYMAPAKPSGPTITACARPRAASIPAAGTFLLQDGAIPAALVEIIGEVATTGAQFGRLGYNKLPAWFRSGAFDPLAVHRQAMENSQVFLVMSDDGAKGTLRFRGAASTEYPEGGGVIPVWNGKCRDRCRPQDPSEPDEKPPAGAGSPLVDIDRLLARHDREAGLNGGQYVPNPLWKLLAESATKVMSGHFPGGRLLTVHPLGGCAMGDSINEGVVNHDGQVFNAKDGGRPYPGLYVMDGSILPGALGENPFLTIAALAWRACNALAIDDKDFTAKAPLPRSLQPPPPRRSADAEIVIREQLVGALSVQSEDDRQRLRDAFPASDRWFEHDRLVLRIESRPSSTSAALTGIGKVQVVARLYESPVGGDQALRWHTYGVRAADLDDSHLIASGEGTLTMMEAAAPKDDKELRARRKSVLRAYRSRRDPGWWLAPLNLFGLVKDERPGDGLIGRAKGMLSLAEMQATYRRFDYDLKLRTRGVTGSCAIRITGGKQLAWAQGNPRLWQAFMGLDATFDFGWPAVKATSNLYVDMNYLVGDGLLSAASDRNSPHAIFNCLAYVMRLARCAVQAGFWEFGAPTYPKAGLKRDADPPTRIGRVRRRTHDLQVEPRLGRSSNPIVLKLHQYGSGGQAGPVLLLHGLAQGSLIFAHRKLRMSMASYFLAQGYDVWLLDYRLSNTLCGIRYDGWSIDEIGQFDIPRAVEYVASYSNRKIHIFAHCVGAVAISMAILRRRVSAAQIASVALNAIHPWVMPSPYNAVRAKLGVLFRDLIGNDCLDPIPRIESEVDTTQSILDRLAFSLARVDEEAADRHALRDTNQANAICDRMTFLYGRMWRHANVQAIHRCWKDLVGPAPGAVYRHLQYLLTWQRIVDREGKEDAYLNVDGLRNWLGIRTLFMHGEDSLVFNPQSATRSAIRLRRVARELERLPWPRSIPVPTTPVRLRRVPGYGHMDVILADDAHQRSFPYLHHFFRGRFDSSDTYAPEGEAPLSMNPINDDDDPDAKLALQPYCGPVLRAARFRDGHLIARYWLETPPVEVTTIDGADLLDPKPLKRDSIPCAPDVDPCYCWMDAEYDAASFPSFPLPWRARLERLSQGKLQDCHFIVASCCYPGTPFDRELSDQAFAGIDALLDAGDVCDALFLIGDQIYADASAGLFDPLSWRDRYVDRYFDAFRSPRMKSVLRKIPTHFAIDDHEIANDYAGYVPQPNRPLVGLKPGTQRTRDIQTGGIDSTQLEFAKLAARSYMGAARHERPFGASGAEGGVLWYALDDGAEISCPAFVMDTRSERKRALPNGQEEAAMAGPAQIAALIAWLDRIKADPRPKFIFSGSVIAPLEKGSAAAGSWMREDGFAGYPEELEAIVARIVAHDIQRVVFIGGDLHLSCAAELTLARTRSHKVVRAIQIVSSGLYAPFNFVNTTRDDVEWGKAATLPLRDHSIGCTPQLLAAGVSHFLKVSAAPAAGGQWEISTTAHDKDATPIHPALRFTL